MTAPLDARSGADGTRPILTPDDQALRRRLERMTLNALVAEHPGVTSVLAEHGVDPDARCHVAARGHMSLRQVLGRVCPVDDVEATWYDLVQHVKAD